LSIEIQLDVLRRRVAGGASNEPVSSGLTSLQKTVKNESPSFEPS